MILISNGDIRSAFQEKFNHLLPVMRCSCIEGSLADDVLCHIQLCSICDQHLSHRNVVRIRNHVESCPTVVIPPPPICSVGNQEVEGLRLGMRWMFETRRIVHGRVAIMCCKVYVSYER